MVVMQREEEEKKVRGIQLQVFVHARLVKHAHVIVCYR